MHLLRFILTGFSVLALAGWYTLQTPHSPSQILLPGITTAFLVNAQTPEAGTSLSEAARGWPGVTAAAYNPSSGLLVLRFTKITSEPELKQRLEVLMPHPVYKAAPPDHSGPYPLSLNQIPGILLTVGLVACLFSLLLWYRATNSQRTVLSA